MVEHVAMKLPSALLAKFFLAAGLTCATLLPTSTAAAQACGDWEDLGTFGGTRAFASSASADASVIVGAAYDPYDRYLAFRWTALGGLQQLGTLGGDESLAYGVSADGSVIAGWALDPSQEVRAFRLTSSTGMQNLGVLPGDTQSMANGLSGDGNVVVGWSGNGFWDGASAMRWSVATGMQSLGTLQGDTSSFARATSADGSVVVGISASWTGTRAFRWSASTGMEDIGGVPGYTNNEACGVSADGNVIIGFAWNDSSHSMAFRWTAATGIDVLDESLTVSIPYGISADGKSVVGWRAFRWTGTTGMEFLEQMGVEGTGFDVSDDGRIVVGSAYDDSGYNRAFRLEMSAVGASYCGRAIANSTGCSGRLFASGNPSVSANDLRLTARFLPLDSFGFFLTSRTPSSIYPVSQSQGRLCLGGSIGRFGGPGQVQNSGSSGSFSLAIDLAALPTPTGPAVAQPGETWYFQAWHRDANPTLTSNFTDAVKVPLE